MKFLVMRKDAIKRGGTAALSSSCFPIEVEVSPTTTGFTDEDIVRMACIQLNDGYSPGEYDYVVVPMRDASIVSFRKPQPKFEVTVRSYVGM